MTVHRFTRQEELWHALTHGIGAILSVACLVLLVVFASFSGNPWKIVSVTIFGATMFLMYLASTLVHSLPEGKWKDVFLLLDHSAIYLFIAGTYTPFLFVPLKGALGWVLFGIVWFIAVVGIVYQLFFIEKFPLLSTLFYLAMGWLIVFAWGPLTAVLHQYGVLLLVIGGLIYTIGAVFYLWRKIPYHHVIWHVFVLLGSGFHFSAVFFYVL